MQDFVVYRRGVLVALAALPVWRVLAARSAPETAVEAVQRLTDELLHIMRAGVHTPFSERFDMLAPVVEQTFDLPAILQESVGLSWSNLPAEQQTMLLQAFRRYTVASYVNNFDAFNGERFEVKPATRPVGNGEQVVQTRMIPVSGAGFELDYVMREGTAGWRAVDVLADGSISRVATQRSDFRRLLNRGGAEALAESLRTKSVDLSGAS